jgi:hypothetical protein
MCINYNAICTSCNVCVLFIGSDIERIFIYILGENGVM